MADFLRGVGQATGVIGLVLVALIFLGSALLLRNVDKRSDVGLIKLHVKGLIRLEIHRSVDLEPDKRPEIGS